MLADASTDRIRGGAAVSLLALVEEHDEADIIIDASAPLIHSIVDVGRDDGKWTLFPLQDGELRVLRVRAQFAEARGWRVADFEGASTKQRKSLPVLVYEETTEDSVNSIESLLAEERGRRGKSLRVAGQRVGRHELRRLGSRLPPARSVSHVCSAGDHCDCFTRVRHAIRAGHALRELAIQRSSTAGCAPH